MSISPVLLWFVAGLVFFFVELILPGFIVFFFGLGAWVTALLSFFLPIPPLPQLGIFLFASLLSLFALRRYLSPVFIGQSKKEHDSMESEGIGATVEVVSEIDPPGEGRIRYSGSYWRAAAEEHVAVGEFVEIIDRQNMLMLVKSSQTQEEKKL